MQNIILGLCDLISNNEIIIQKKVAFIDMESIFLLSCLCCNCLYFQFLKIPVIKMWARKRWGICSCFSGCSVAIISVEVWTANSEELINFSASCIVICIMFSVNMDLFFFNFYLFFFQVWFRVKHHIRDPKQQLEKKKLVAFWLEHYAKRDHGKPLTVVFDMSETGISHIVSIFIVLFWLLSELCNLCL